MKKYIQTLLIGLFSFPLLGQNTSEYPKTATYFGVVHPIVTIDKNGTHTNFDEYYTVGFPVGINIWKTHHVGFSFEVAPFIRTENGVSKVNNILFHPGLLFHLGKGFSFAGRAAFETSGRFGLTPIFTKTIIKNKTHNIFLSTPLPIRFGNDKPSSFGLGLQVGIIF